MYADFETHGFQHDPDGYVYLVCWHIDGVDKHSYIQQEGWHRFAEDLLRCGEITAHNARFELAWLVRDGVLSQQELARIKVYDTMLAEWVLAGEKPLDLDSVAVRYGIRGKHKLPSLLIKRGQQIETIPYLLEYCYQDVHMMMPVRRAQEKLLNELGMMHIAEQRFAVCPVLVDLASRPQLLDKALVAEKYQETYNSMHAIDAVLDKYETNLNSGTQLATLLYDTLGFEVPLIKGKPAMTAGGKRSTSEGTISLLQATTPEQQEFLDLYFKRNKLSSLLSKYLNYFYACDGKLWGDIVQGNTATHRLASNGRKVKVGKKKLGCQIQNIPRELKQLITAPEGWAVVEADYAQLEFVGAADMCNDAMAKHDILHGKKEDGTDPHSNTARILTENGQPSSRQEAKSSTFSPLYGGFGKTKAEKKYVEYFKNRYTAIAAEQASWAVDVVASPRKEFVTKYGMRFRYPNADISSSGYIKGSTQIYNYPIQGFSTGEVVPIALRLVWERLIGVGWCYISSTVHDSIVLVCRIDKLDELNKILEEEMLAGTIEYLRSKYHYTFTTPLTIEIKSGDHWGEDQYGKHEVTLGI